MNLENYKPKGEIKDFPKEVIEKMLEYQVEQANNENIEVFEKDRYCGRENGGFDYSSTKEGCEFWRTVIDNDFDVFFKKYPTEEYTIEEAINFLKKLGYHVFPSDEYGIPDLSEFEGIELEVGNSYSSKWEKKKVICRIRSEKHPYLLSDGFFCGQVKLVQEELDFDWDCLPKWIDKYIAYSKDYGWYSYDKKPTILLLKEIWYSGGKVCLIPKEYTPKNFKGSFMESVFKNPKYKDEL